MALLREDAREGSPADLVSYFTFTTFDIIGDLSFHEPFHNLELRRPHPLILATMNAIRSGAMVNALMQIPGFSLFLKAFRKVLFSSRGEMTKHTRERVTKRIESGSGRPDFMNKILPHLRADGTGISREEIDATMMILVVAGSETTATLLSGCIYHLLRNPNVMARLSKEVRDAFTSVEEIDLLRVCFSPVYA